MTDDLWPFLWQEYVDTRDDRSRAGDVEILAEAAERMEWPGAPEIGREIAALLRAAYKPPQGEASRHYRVTRDREILGLAEVHAAMGLSQRESSERIADVYGMSAAAVVKVLQRKGVDKPR